MPAGWRKRPLARRLLAEATAAGEEAYQDRGLRHGDLPCPSGRALKESGEAPAVPGPLDEARTRFQLLAEAGEPQRRQNGLDLPGRTSRCPSGSGPARRGGRDVRGSHRACRAERRSPRCGHRPVPAWYVRLLQRRYREPSRHTTRPARLSRPGRAAEGRQGLAPDGRSVPQCGAVRRGRDGVPERPARLVELGNRPGEASYAERARNLYGATGRHGGRRPLLPRSRDDLR